MQRMLRVWRLLPPRNSIGAHSRTVTEAPHSRAVSAAQSAAFPPPAMTTSDEISTLLVQERDAREWRRRRESPVWRCCSQRSSAFLGYTLSTLGGRIDADA